jgi:hypothetical protein
MKIINMTPHKVDIVGVDGQVVTTYPPSGNTIRLGVNTVRTGSLPDGTPLTKTNFGSPIGLPAHSGWWDGVGVLDYTDRNVKNWDAICHERGFTPTPNTYYIVSQIIKNALPHRDDLLVPADVVRDDRGNIIGCKSLGV